MSALGQKQICAVQLGMSALPPKQTYAVHQPCLLWAKSGHQCKRRRLRGGILKFVTFLRGLQQQPPQSRQRQQSSTLAPVKLYRGPSRSFAFRLFDHLVGACEQRWGYGQADGLGGLEVDNELELGGLLHR